MRHKHRPLKTRLSLLRRFRTPGASSLTPLTSSRIGRIPRSDHFRSCATCTEILPFYLSLHKSINPPSFFRCRPSYPANNTAVIKPQSQAPFPFPQPSLITPSLPFPSQHLPFPPLPLKKINSLPSIPSHHIHPPHHVSQTERQKAELRRRIGAESRIVRGDWWCCRGRNECRMWLCWRSTVRGWCCDTLLFAEAAVRCVWCGNFGTWAFHILAAHAPQISGVDPCRSSLWPNYVLRADKPRSNP
jgi:hypothetical protein